MMLFLIILIMQDFIMNHLHFNFLIFLILFHNVNLIYLNLLLLYFLNFIINLMQQIINLQNLLQLLIIHLISKNPLITFILHFYKTMLILLLHKVQHQQFFYQVYEDLYYIIIIFKYYHEDLYQIKHNYFLIQKGC